MSSPSEWAKNSDWRPRGPEPAAAASRRSSETSPDVDRRVASRNTGLVLDSRHVDHRPPPLLFTAQERDLIRRSFCMQFSQYPSVADGILLRTWRGGPSAGERKMPPAVRTMLERA